MTLTRFHYTHSLPVVVQEERPLIKVNHRWWWVTSLLGLVLHFTLKIVNYKDFVALESSWSTSRATTLAWLHFPNGGRLPKPEIPATKMETGAVAATRQPPHNKYPWCGTPHPLWSWRIVLVQLNLNRNWNQDKNARERHYHYILQPMWWMPTSTMGLYRKRVLRRRKGQNLVTMSQLEMLT